MKPTGGMAFPGFEYVPGHGPAKRAAGVPGSDSDAWEVHQPGMTLRDYFAAKALVECIRVAADQTLSADPLLSDLFDKAAAYAYYAADAMIAERDKK